MSKQHDIESLNAYKKWRGTKPAGGYGYDLVSWDYDDALLQKCWKAAVKWTIKTRPCVSRAFERVSK